ncbi:hypothetical protein IQ257_04560 [Coleofasciculus sp. LEGE 07092]|nr:hypothetical protein [Coleofasciculus sp. LEGE 07081]MBE9147793.1 hypothetical protein [Coleofasciculus sp. LEGE 07092]
MEILLQEWDDSLFFEEWDGEILLNDLDADVSLAPREADLLFSEWKDLEETLDRLLTVCREWDV